MNSIEVKVYRCGIKWKFIRSIPKSMNELDQTQYLSLIKYMNGQITEAKFVSSFFFLPYFVVRYGLDSFQLYKLIDEISNISSLKQSCSRMLIEKIPGTKFENKMPLLKGMSFLRFMYIDTQYTRYIQTRDSIDLNRFLAALYINPKKSFAKIDIVSQASIIQKKINSICSEAILLNYIMLKKWLSEIYPYMFSIPDGLPQGTSSKKQQQNWVEIFDALVGEDIPETAFYQNMPCMDAFRVINNRIKTYKNAN